MRSGQQISPSVLLGRAEKLARTYKKKRKDSVWRDLHLVSGWMVGWGHAGRQYLFVFCLDCVPSAKD